MASDSLTNSSLNLNLSRRQAELFQDMFLTGTKMAKKLAKLEAEPMHAREAASLAHKWNKLMSQFVRMLI